VVFPADALVLAAGFGTRLQPLTSVRAKPAIPLAGEPIARRIVSWLAASGVNRATVNLHHLPHTLTAVLGDGTDLGAHVRYSWESPRGWLLTGIFWKPFGQPIWSSGSARSVFTRAFRGPPAEISAACTASGASVANDLGAVAQATSTPAACLHTS